MFLFHTSFCCRYSFSVNNFFILLQRLDVAIVNDVNDVNERNYIDEEQETNSLFKEEDRHAGTVTWRTYLAYFHHMGSLPILLGTFFFIIIIILLTIFEFYFFIIHVGFIYFFLRREAPYPLRDLCC